MNVLTQQSIYVTSALEMVSFKRNALYKTTFLLTYLSPNIVSYDGSVYSGISDDRAYTSTFVFTW